MDAPLSPLGPPARSNTMRSFLGAPPVVEPEYSQQLCQVKALYDYEGGAGELSFYVGDIMDVTAYDDDNSGWWTATLRGQSGVIPSTYVELL